MEPKSPVKIDQKITGYSVVSAEDKAKAAAAPAPTPAEVEKVYLEAKPYERPLQVTGTTYKIKPPTASHALYITINNIVTAEGKLRPIEIFINTKHVEHFQWVAALTRVISALLRKPGPYLFVIEELMQVFDPQGGYWLPGGKMMPSVVAEIGSVFKQHCETIGAVDAPALSEAQKALISEKKAVAEAKGIKGKLCGKCGEHTVVLIDNCMTCLSCSDSKCG